MEKKKIWPLVLVSLLFLSAALTGGLLGLGLSYTVNTKNTENFTDFETALPTKLLDINGELITEFSSDEKREIISLKSLPPQMIAALLTREDRIFYEHNGFSAKALFRAVIGVLTKSSLGGGSTLTQQIAGTLYCDRSDYSIKRKLKELWWAIQMERRYSKDEILELYLNKIYFGGGTYGVNAASKYYFGHGAREISPAEAAILVIQLSNPAYYNPFDYPNRAKDRQQYVLAEMVESGYLTKEEADESFENYWATFDYTRTNTSAYSMRDDKAPWFSEYVRRNLGEMLFGTEDIYTSGFTVNTTLNLSHQKAAEEVMSDYIGFANRSYQRTMSNHEKDAFKTYIPLSELIGLVFNLPDLKVSEQRSQAIALSEYSSTINPIIDVFSLIGGMENLKTEVVNKGNALIKQKDERTTIEGTMIAVENSTGYIDALVGGSKYDQENQFIRAVQAKLQPGSTFKPLYYSAAIDSKLLTMTSIISDTPEVFHNQDGTPYIPQDFKGQWEGDVQLWYALAHSMNVPSIKVLDKIGFDAAINRTSSLYGIPQNELAERHFEHIYPLGLGVCSVRPIEVAKAFATIENNGKEVVPFAIRTIEDKNGNIIKNPEKEIRSSQVAKGNKAQIISEQNAFIMQELLKETVRSGTLRYGVNWDSTAWTIGERKGKGGPNSKLQVTNENGYTFTMPAAGKTGTTQNWADAWTVGFTPYYTAVFWFGFDRPGQSLGLSLTGSTLAGVAWGDYMAEVNQGKPLKQFRDDIPEGVVKLEVCSVSGGLLTPECGDHKITAYYLAGTQPKDNCRVHSTDSTSLSIIRLRQEKMQTGLSYSLDDGGVSIPSLDFLKSDKTSAELNLSTVESEENFNMEDNEDNDFGNWLLR